MLRNADIIAPKYKFSIAAVCVATVVALSSSVLASDTDEAIESSSINQ